MDECLIGLILYLYIICSIYIVVFALDCDFSIFNPIKIHNKWKSLNLFGICVITILLNMICLPYAIIYWVYRLIKFLFIIKKDNICERK